MNPESLAAIVILYIIILPLVPLVVYTYLRLEQDRANTKPIDRMGLAAPEIFGTPAINEVSPHLYKEPTPTPNITVIEMINIEHAYKPMLEEITEIPRSPTLTFQRLLPPDKVLTHRMSLSRAFTTLSSEELVTRIPETVNYVYIKHINEKD